jgi:DNA relaxase NicK
MKKRRIVEKGDFDTLISQKSYFVTCSKICNSFMTILKQLYTTRHMQTISEAAATLQFINQTQRSVF